MLFSYLQTQYLMSLITATFILGDYVPSLLYLCVCAQFEMPNNTLSITLLCVLKLLHSPTFSLAKRGRLNKWKGICNVPLCLFGHCVDVLLCVSKATVVKCC